MQWQGLDLSELANSAIILLTALIGFAAVYVGRRAKEIQERSPTAAISVNGAAIISSEAINALAGSVEALGAEMIERRQADEKMRGLIHQQIEGDRHVVEQMRELRLAMGRLGDIMIQRS